MQRTVIATPELGGRSFRFELQRVEKTLGALGSVPYYFLDSAQLRRNPPGANFRSCIDFYWTAMEVEGAQDYHSKMNLVFAEIYPYVCKARSQQDIYNDAFIHAMECWESAGLKNEGGRMQEPEWRYELPPEEDARLRKLARSQDALLVQEELDKILRAAKPNYADHAVFKECASEWLQDGVKAFDEGGQPHLLKYAASFEPLSAKLRKRGGVPRVRDFLNRFQYECKIGFYLCYANAWIGIIKWLKENQGLSNSSERLLRTWHMQGETLENEFDIPGKSRDPFFGQILALHPLSLFALHKSEHLELISKWIGHAQFEDLVDRGQEGSAPEYWQMVEAALVAAAEYKQTRDKWIETYPEYKKARECKNKGAAQRPVLGAGDEKSAAFHFNDFALGEKIVCLQCGKSVEYVNHIPPNDKGGNVNIIYKCRGCSAERAVIISEQVLKKFLAPDKEQDLTDSTRSG